MKEIIYLLQTYKSKENICRLVRVLKRYVPESFIIIRHDSREFFLDEKIFSDLKGIKIFNENITFERGTFAFTQVLIDVMKWLRENSIEFDWLINLSEQDYPVKNPRKVNEFLSVTKFDAFTRYWSFFSESGKAEKGRLLKRYYSQYIFFSSKLKLFYRILFSFYNKMPSILKLFTLHFYPYYGMALGMSVSRTPFSNNFILYRGYGWHYLSRKCCDYILEFIANNPQIVKYFKRVILSEECLFQTILLNAKKFNICDDYRRYVYLDNQPEGHPLILTVEDFKTITSGKYDFARKFNPEEDSKILHMLDMFLEKDSGDD